LTIVPDIKIYLKPKNGYGKRQDLLVSSPLGH